MRRTGPTHLDVSQGTGMISLLAIVAVVIAMVVVVRRGMK